MKRKLRFFLLMLFILTALALPTVNATGDDDIARCSVQRLFCTDYADANYAACMATPAGTYAVCSLWWYWDKNSCMSESGCSGFID